MKVTVRLKITALFAILFTVLAAVLVATAYSFMATKTTREAEAEARSAAFREALAAAGVALPDFPDRQPGEGRGSPGIVVMGPGEQVEIAIRDIEEQARQNVLHDLLLVSLLAFLIVAVVAIPVSWWLAGRVLRPIDEMVAEASSLSATKSVASPADAGTRRRIPPAQDRVQRHARSPRVGIRGAATVRLRRVPRTPDASRGDGCDGRQRPRRRRARSAGRPRPRGRGARAGGRSESLVDSLLTLARADDVRKTRTQVDLADVAADAVSIIADAAAATGVEIGLELADAPVEGDSVLLARMVVNALDNAVKYNRASGGKIECSTLVDGADACLRVANTGPEVSEKEIPRLFERFERGATRSEANGQGLGLPIIRRVAEAHGGSAAASPRPGGGLVVEIRLPRAVASK